jgi:hypothetical protein
MVKIKKLLEKLSQGDSRFVTGGLSLSDAAPPAKPTTWAEKWYNYRKPRLREDEAVRAREAAATFGRKARALNSYIAGRKGNMYESPSQTGGIEGVMPISPKFKGASALIDVAKCKIAQTGALMGGKNFGNQAPTQQPGWLDRLFVNSQRQLLPPQSEIAARPGVKGLGPFVRQSNPLTGSPQMVPYYKSTVWKGGSAPKKTTKEIVSKKATKEDKIEVDSTNNTMCCHFGGSTLEGPAGIMDELLTLIQTDEDQAGKVLGSLLNEGVVAFND